MGTAFSQQSDRLLICYASSQALFISSSRELKRLDSLLMSPIFGNFGETISGLLTIRAFRRQSMFLQKNQQLLDSSNRSYWTIQVVRVALLPHMLSTDLCTQACCQASAL